MLGINRPMGGVNPSVKNNSCKCNLFKSVSIPLLIFSMFVGSNVFAITKADVERMGIDKTQQYFVEKYNAKNWDDLINNTQVTDMDKEDAEIIKLILKKRQDVQVIASKMQMEQKESDMKMIKSKLNKKRADMQILKAKAQELNSNNVMLIPAK